MRNAIEDEVSVGTHQLCQVYVFVVDAEVVAFSDEAFNYLNHGALSKIIRARFEAKAQNANSCGTSVQDELQAFGNLRFVAGQDGGHNWQRKILRFGLISQSSKIFRKA